MKLRHVGACGLAALVLVLSPLQGIADEAPELGSSEFFEADEPEDDAIESAVAAEAEVSGEHGPAHGLAYAVTTTNRLLTFRITSPTILTNVAISGLPAGVDIVGIDVRPANGSLYGLGSNSRLYLLNAGTGAATLASTLSVPLNGSAFGIDFNPVVDRLRVVSDTDQNLRVNVDTGAVIVDTPLAFQAGTVNAGVNPNVAASAYTNSFAGATSTRLFGIDSSLHALVEQVSPNGGTLVTHGGIGPNTLSGLVGFDISPENLAFAIVNVAGATTSQFLIIDLSEILAGSAGLFTVTRGAIGGGTTIRGFALAGPACTISGAGSIFGTSGNDVICGSSGSDFIVGGGGFDVIFGFAGDDSIVGNSTSDIIFAGEGNDSITGDGGNDLLVGGPGNDRLIGDDGNDFLAGGSGADLLVGGAGVNTLSGGPGNDACFEANGGTVSSCNP